MNSYAYCVIKYFLFFTVLFCGLERWGDRAALLTQKCCSTNIRAARNF